MDGFRLMCYNAEGVRKLSAQDEILGLDIRIGSNTL
jgi:hypothetical protein